MGADGSVPDGMPPRAALLRLVRSNGAGLADQALVSATNFATLFLVARGLSQPDFGAFSVAYTVLLLLISLENALVTQPHNVLGSSKYASDYRAYTSSTARSETLFLAVATVGLAAAAAVVSATGSHLAGLAFATVAAGAGWGVQEFFRRLLYTSGRFGAAFLNDLLSYGTQAVVVLILVLTDRLTPAAAMLTIAITSAIAAGAGYLTLRPQLGAQPQPEMVRENWKFGRWLAAEPLGYWLSIQGFLVLAAAFRGARAPGILKATQLLLGPLNIVLLYLAAVLPIRYAKTYASAGITGLQRDVRKTYAVVLPVVGLYGLAVSLAGGQLMRLAFGPAYAPYGNILALQAGFYFASAIAQVLTAAVKARAQSSALFRAHAVSLGIAACSGWLFVKTLGIAGAVTGMIVSTLVLALMLLLRRDNNGAGGATLGFESGEQGDHQHV